MIREKRLAPGPTIDPDRSGAPRTVSRRHAWRRAVGLSIVAALGSLVGFCVLEGTASLILFASKVIEVRTPAFEERRHTAYDAELGWVSRPNVVAPDLYGPGIGLTTNAQGFRGARDVAVRAPDDRLRLVCSGDSFTLGYGVADESTWCSRLGELDRRLETVNMGQGGYGVDQAYLWYARDGYRLEHAVLVFALITGDFERMRRPVFLGHGKPVLTVRDDRLVTGNVPVPKFPSGHPLFWRRLSLASRDLRASQLVGRLRTWRRGAPAASGGVRFDESTWAVASKVFERLNAMSRERHRAFVVLYLPTGDDYESPESDPWRERLRTQASEQGFSFVDLTQEFRDLPIRTMRSLFLGAESPGNGHYNGAGHAWVADRLLRRIEAIPAVGARLAELVRGQGPSRPMPTADRSTDSAIRGAGPDAP